MFNPSLYLDGYKTGHKAQYPDNTQYVYSNLTPRSSRVPDQDYVVFFGLQYFLKEYLIKQWNENFFNRPKDDVVNEYKRIMDNYLGKDSLDVSHIAELHDLGYLPLLIKALPEGTKVPLKIPMFTIENTVDQFFWLTNYIETIVSNVVWLPTTSATTAHRYRKTLDRYTKETGADEKFVPWQCHDFSFRGMTSVESACTSGAGHLLSFYGTDTVPALLFLEKYYNANSDNEIVGGSVPASEHSVACLNSAMTYTEIEVEEEYNIEITYDDYGNIISEIQL